MAPGGFPGEGQLAGDVGGIEGDEMPGVAGAVDAGAREEGDA